MLPYIFAVSLLVFVAYLFKILVLTNILEGRKKLILLRNPSAWDLADENNPYTGWSWMVYCLNLEGKLRPYEKTYSRAWMIGSTTQELWEIHKAVHRWYITKLLEAFQRGEHIFNRRNLAGYLEEAGCDLIDLGITEKEFKDLQKKILLEIIVEAIKDYQKTDNSFHLLALRPYFEDADVADLKHCELRVVTEDLNLDYVGYATLEYAASKFMEKAPAN
ncbi:hypothetical protein KW791_02600 [Candidatus Parcubacteria bacterium]|nr:hypothetical protein [Candidatus Parcubacteria bacterium]